MSASSDLDAPVKPLRVSVEQAFRSVFDVPLEVPEHQAIKYIQDAIASEQLTLEAGKNVADRYTLVRSDVDINREGFVMDNARLEIAHAYLRLRKFESILEGVSAAIDTLNKSGLDADKLNSLYNTQRQFLEAVAGCREDLEAVENNFYELQELPA